MTNANPPTKTLSTVQRYAETTGNLWRQYLADCGVDGQLLFGAVSLPAHGNAFFAWLQKKAFEVRRSTWRLYRSALYYSVSEAGFPALAEQIKSIPGNEQDRKHGQRTSARKAKTFATEKFDLLCQALVNESKSQYALPLYYWLHCGLMFGLRPSEWQTAAFELVEPESIGFTPDDTYNVGIILTVENGKYTNGRGHGKTRELYACLSEEQYSYLYAHIENMEKYDYEFIYHKCRNLLYDINRRLFNRHQKYIGLYSARHQFNANIKAQAIARKESTVESLENLAAMNGHGSLQTATEHYGRARGGWGSPVAPIKASEQSLAQVRALTQNKRQKLFRDQGISSVPDPSSKSSQN